MTDEKIPVFDVHLHVQPWRMMRKEILDFVMPYVDNIELIQSVMTDPEKLIELMDNANIAKALLINYPSELMGFTSKVNEFIVEYCYKSSDRLFPVGGIDLKNVTEVKKEMVYFVKELGLAALKIHTIHQCIYPNEYLTGNEKLRDVYRYAEEYELPIIFHTGTSVFPGARLKYGNPEYIDDVAIDFPDLKIVIAHAGRPLWMNTAVYLARRHKNIYIDISSIPPRKLTDYLPNIHTIENKLMYGSDWPGFGVRTVSENIEQILNLPLSSEFKSKLLFDTANMVFK